jgi:hypothetical protein
MSWASCNRRSRLVCMAQGDIRAAQHFYSPDLTRKKLKLLTRVPEQTPYGRNPFFPRLGAAKIRNGLHQHGKSGVDGKANITQAKKHPESGPSSLQRLRSRIKMRANERRRGKLFPWHCGSAQPVACFPHPTARGVIHTSGPSSPDIQ